MSDLYTTYKKNIVPELIKELGIKNRMAVPRMVKVVINCGIGAEAQRDKKIIEKAVAQIAAVSGQKPIVTKAKKAISTFKLRENDPVGIKVTIRGNRMYEFITKLNGIALPRVRDFRGIPKKNFDGNGNYTLGIRDQSIFPEIDYAMIDKMRGFEITFVTTGRTNNEALALLTKLGLPFEK
jgi:large subunit ribosomal protein L5